MDVSLIIDRPAQVVSMAEKRSRIERWLIAHIARLADETTNDIDINLPFSHYALDSLATVELTADIEDWLGLRLSPTLVWDYPTISVLSHHLADLKGAPA